MTEDFLKPRLVGERFKDHSVPLEILKDFSVLEQMIVEVAKWKYIQEHPGRERVQRNFTKGLELKLARVEDGSVILAIVLCSTSQSLFPNENLKYLEEARDSIVNSIEMSSEGKNPVLPPHLLSYFATFGSGLREGESINFKKEEKEVVFNTDVRKSLIRASKVEFWTDEVSLRTRISEFDQGRSTFEVELLDGKKLKCEVNEKFIDVIFQAFNGYKKGIGVLLQAVVQKGRQERIEKIDSIVHMTLLDVMDVAMRIEAFKKLETGWLNGKGHALSSFGLDNFSIQFDTNFDSNLPLPFVYPTAEGGVQAEWTMNNWEISLIVDLENMKGEFQALNVGNKRCMEEMLNLNSIEGWGFLNQKLNEIQSEEIVSES